VSSDLYFLAIAIYVHITVIYHLAKRDEKGEYMIYKLGANEQVRLSLVIRNWRLIKTWSF
jgi:hypothetical protein